MKRFSSVLGVFRILRKRVPEVGQPGLLAWVDSGERAAAAVASDASAKAHANECDEIDMASEVEGITADDQVTADELPRLKRLMARLRRCADRSHDIGEVLS